ncbi:hypothetical protein EVAR_94241_1 [Eumeta japonica]|uniref:Uncharacterized protein n=1 Tax=Eumeta variegata TaxID=151549 RepID=A0A4C1UP53_EUMVA|nr:hypothetical protein EVAR_94241_1 [Eumeta japonica]
MLKNTRGRGGAGTVVAERLQLSGGLHLLAALQAFRTSTNSMLPPVRTFNAGGAVAARVIKARHGIPMA